MKRILSALLLLCSGFIAQAQESFPINGVRDIRNGLYAFTNATIIQNENTKIEKGVLIIKMGKIVTVGANLTVPAEAVVVDCAGKFIYPSFIDFSFVCYFGSHKLHIQNHFLNKNIYIYRCIALLVYF